MMRTVSIRIICIMIALFTVSGVFTAYAGEADGKSEITSARISADGSTLTVTATLSEEVLAEHEGRPIYLFELYPGDDSDALDKRAPVTYKLASQELTYELDMTDADPMRKYSKYALATQSGTDYSLIGNVVYVENPEALAEGQATRLTPANAVGILAGEGEISESFAHAVLPVYVNELFADTADGSLRYEYGENVYYIDNEVLARLDSRIKGLSEAGTAVYLQLLLSQPDESTANLAMSLYRTASGGEYYAPDTATPLGMRLWSSLVEFLCGRYCSDSEKGNVTAFILGNNINEHANYAGGGETVEEFTKELCCTLRVTETAISSTCGGVDLYVSLGGEYSGSFTDAFPIRDMLADLCVPDVSFGIYMDVSTDAPDFWNEEGITSDSATPRITPKNIDLLIELMGSDRMLCDGDVRKVLLGYSADGTDRDMQAASVLCALYRALTLNGAEAVIYNTYADSEGANNGLFAEGIPKTAYSQLCDAAGGDLLTLQGQIRTLMGDAEYEGLRDGVLSDLFVARSPLPLYTGEIPGEVNAIYLADFVDGSLYGFEPGITTLTHGFTMDSSGKVLRLTAKKDTVGMTGAFDGYDLSEKNIMVIELKALTEGDSAEYTLMISGKKDGEQVCLESVTELVPGRWNELAFDISGIDSLDEISFTVVSSEGAELSAYLKSITVFSTGSASALAVKIAVSVLVIVLILFIALVVTLIYMRSRKRPVRRDRYRVSRRPAPAKAEAKPAPIQKKQEPVAKIDRKIPVMPKTESKTFVVPPKKEEPVKRATMSLGIEPISADTVIDIDKTGEND